MIVRSRFFHTLLCFLPLGLFGLLFIGLQVGGMYLLLPALFMVLVVPLLDTITGWQSTQNFREKDFTALEKAALDLSPRMYAVAYFLSVLTVAYGINRFDGTEIICLVLVFSLIGANCFGVTHELLHRQTKLDYRLQFIGSIFLGYPHYRIIHLRSHHIQAATEEDKNTAWINEGYFSYLMRTIPESFARSWELETNRLVRRNGYSGPVYQNKVLVFWTVELIFQIVVIALLGLVAWAFVLAQIIGSNLILESVNYLQHYGLMRRAHGGKYEKIGSAHSWDSYHFFSSYLTYRVGHHCYHHLEPNEPYYLLKAVPDSPKLPVGYLWAIVLTMVPPLWRAVIHPRLAEYQGVNTAGV